MNILGVCKNDPVFAKPPIGPPRSDLSTSSEDRLPANFYTDSGITRTIVPPSLGSRKILADAMKLYQGQDFEQSLKTLRQFDVAKEDREAKREYYTLYAKLGEKGVLTRDQVHSLEKMAGEFGRIKPYLAKSMAETIAKSSWKTWPAKDDTWAGRLADAEFSQSDQPIVKAFKAEAMLESGKSIDLALPATGDEKPYIDHVRGGAASTRGDDQTAAARALVNYLAMHRGLCSPPRPCRHGAAEGRQRAVPFAGRQPAPVESAADAGRRTRGSTSRCSSRASR